MKRRGAIWLMVGLILALLAGLSTFRLLAQTAASSSSEQEGVQMTTVVVAAVSIPPGTVLESTAVELKSVPLALVPESAVRSLDEVVGKIALDRIGLGEVLVTHRLADPTHQAENIAFTMPEDKVLFALQGGDKLTQAGVLKAGDKVDLLFSFYADAADDSGSVEKLVTLSAVQNLEITAIVVPGVLPQSVGPSFNAGGSDSETTLLFAMDPQDALVIKYLKDAGGVLDITLRSATDERVIYTQSVTVEYLADRYQFDLEPGDSLPLFSEDSSTK